MSSLFTLQYADLPNVPTMKRCGGASPDFAPVSTKRAKVGDVNSPRLRIIPQLQVVVINAKC